VNRSTAITLAALAGLVARGQTVEAAASALGLTGAERTRLVGLLGELTK
jgi:hypothetical protein